MQKTACPQVDIDMDPDLVIDQRLRFTLKLLKLPSEHPMCKCTTNAATACKCLGTPVKDFQGTWQQQQVLLIVQVARCFLLQFRPSLEELLYAGQDKHRGFYFEW